MRPEERDQAYLWDMLRAARDIVEFTKDLSFDTFARDKRPRFAVERQLLVVGEAVSHVTEVFRSNHPEIPWTPILDPRNVLADDYGEVLVAIWLAAQKDIPSLVRRLAGAPAGRLRIAEQQMRRRLL